MKFTEMPYTRVDKDQTIAEFKAIIEKAANAASGEELWENHRAYYKLDGSVNTNATLAQVRYTINTADEFYDAENNYYDEFLPEYRVLCDEYNKTIYASPYRDYLESKIGPVAIKNIEIDMKAFDERVLKLSQEENALVTRYGKLIASAEIHFNGEIYNLAGMKPFTQDQDRSVRKAAQDAISAYFQTVTDELDEIYDLLVKNRTEQARVMGYENYVELGYYRMRRNSYDRNMVENFRKQVKASFVPFVSEIHEQRRVRIGVDKLKSYDGGMYFKEGNPVPVGGPEEIMANGLKMYQELSPETKEFMEFMAENELYDVVTKKNKEQGGYMTMFRDFKAPFIFGNCSGTNDDVGLVTHECGHAFQGYVQRDEEIIEHTDIGMETAEVHSMSMEFFTYDWMDKFFGDDTERYYQLHFADSVIFIPYGCMVDEFQHRVYEKPEMTPAERKAVWRELEKSYRPLLDYDGDPYFEAGGYWQRQSHIFGMPFYYIDYVLAGICAMMYKVWMDEDRDAAWQSYLKLCKMGARGFFADMLKEVGLDSPFEDGSIEKLVSKLKTKI